MNYVDTQSGLCAGCTAFDGIDSIDNVLLKIIIKKKDNELSLWPTKDLLKLHRKWAAYQTAIWRCCGDTHIKHPLPENHGWKVTEGLGLKPKWSLKADKLPAVTEFLQCGCKAGCVSRKNTTALTSADTGTVQTCL